MRVTIAVSKTDQEGHGVEVGVPVSASPATCPVAWLRRWLAGSGIDTGPIFHMVAADGSVRDGRLAPQTVCALVKRHAARIGLDPAAYSAHSLRAGLATSAAAGGASPLRLADHGRWRSLAIVQGYVRSAQSLDQGNPVRAAGL
jgi:integrase